VDTEANHELLAKFPVVVRFPVQWGDQDAHGHVNNVIPHRWFESPPAPLQQTRPGDLRPSPGLEFEGVRACRSDDTDARDKGTGFRGRQARAPETTGRWALKKPSVTWCPRAEPVGSSFPASN
jgi:hypothetical protein